MKTFNPKLLTLMLLIAVASFGLTKASEAKGKMQTMSDCLRQYVNLVKLGELSNVDKIFADNVKFNVSHNGKVTTHTKSEEIQFLKKNRDVAQQCEVSSTTMVSTDSFKVVKVSLVYPDFTRENYVTFSKLGNDWKITDVSSEFK